MALRIVEALDAYLRTWGTSKNRAALEELKRARADMTFADGTLLEMARQQYAHGSDDNVEIDDGAITSESDTGMWVNAWVHIRLPKGGR
jgi:hypothetical protein